MKKLKRLGRVYAKQEGQEVAVYDGSYALLIGVSDYDDPKSWNPSDLEMEKAIKDFIRVHGAKENARLLIYYSGHGYSTDAGKFKIGWLVPRNAPHPLGAPEAFRVTALSMRRINEYSEIIRSKHVLWVFDSCFSGSVFDMAPGRSAASDDLPRYWDERIRGVITSGSADETVPDQSIFRELFVEALGGKHRVGRRTSLFTGYELGDFLKDMVYRYRDKQQTPQNGVVPIRGLDTGAFIFQVPANAR
jgi:hypothetical protein